MDASHLPGDLELSSSSEEEDLNISQLIRNLSTDLKESSPALIVNVLGKQEALRIWNCHEAEEQGTEEQGTEEKGTNNQGTEEKGTEEKGAERTFCPDLVKEPIKEQLFFEKSYHSLNIEEKLNCFKEENFRLQSELFDCKLKLREIKDGLEAHSNVGSVGADILVNNEAKKKLEESSDSEDEIASVSSVSLDYKDGSLDSSICSTMDLGSPPVIQLREKRAERSYEGGEENDFMVEKSAATKESEAKYPGSRGTMGMSRRGRGASGSRGWKEGRTLASVKQDSDPGPSSASSRRSSQSGDTTSRKRRSTGDMGLVLDTVQLDGLVRDLIRHQDSWPFCRPVSLKEAPDYLEVVKRPMDLEAIRQRLDGLKVYTHNHQVLEDIELVFYNCSEYNPPGSEERMCGQRLELYYRQCRQKMSLKIPKWSKSALSL